MKKKLIGMLTLFMALVVHISYAQEKTISGTVTNNSGLLLPGVNVVVKNTSNGTQTDFDGKFVITANEGETLQFSYIGFITKDFIVNTNESIIVQLEEDTAQLEEVVITAQGIKAKPRSLSYAVTTIGDEEIENTGEINLVSSLTAKAPGVSVISSSGSVGSSANIRIRGNTSILRSNSPLFVVDGVPIDNQNTASDNPGGNTGGTDNSNRAIDINQNDIESISILKGVAAQTLYGLRAANGVVLITTKKGKNGTPSVSFNSSIQFSEITQVPKLQREYAQGRPLGNNFTYRGPETREGFSWGPAISNLEYNGDRSYPYDMNGGLVLKGNGNGIPARSYDHYDFFVQGFLSDINASVRGGSDKVKYYISAGKLDQSGVSPTENFGKKSFRSDFTASLTDNFELSASGSYINSGGARVQRGSNISGIMLGLLRSAPTFDNGNGLTGRTAAGRRSTYGFINDSGEFAQRSYRGGVYDNPYWTVAQNPTTDDVNRFIGRLSFDYTPFEWLTLRGRYSFDRYSDIRKAAQNINSANNPQGRLFDDNIFNQDVTTNFFAIFDRNISENITFNGLIGYENYSSSYLRRNVLADGLSVPGFYQLSNTTTQITSENIIEKKTDGVFADAKFGFNDTYFVNATIRNDWSSALPEDNNEFLSYSMGGSFVFSELFQSIILNYGKLRASYGRTGNDAPVYATTTYYNTGEAGGDGFIDNNIFPVFNTVSFERSNILGNDYINPEETTEYEIGTELKFLDSRITLDFTYYDKKTSDQVLDVDLAPSTGFNSRFINIGEIENKGFEVGFTLNPIQTENFNWTIDINWTTYTSEVVELADGVESYTLDGFASTSSRVLPGESYGSIFGSRYLRNDAGNVLIDDNGFPLVNPVDGVVGDPIPDWQSGVRNTFSYKDFSLSFLFDIREGGDVWCGTCGILDYFGVSQATADQRNISDFVYNGIIQSSGAVNNIPVAFANPADGLNAIKWVRYGFGGISEDYVYDASWVRLREASLTYSLADKIVERLPITSGSLTVSGRNLWLSTDYPGVDPETNLTGDSNGIGLDYFNQPNTRSYLVSLKLNF